MDYEVLREERLASVSAEYREAIAMWPRLTEVGLAGLRAGIAASAGQVPVAPGVDIEDVVVPGPGGGVPTRLYIPEAVADRSPGVALHVHFGGFVAGGGLATLDGINSRMAAAAGCVVVAPDFRLPPEHKFPAGLEDCWAVLRWIGEVAGERGWERDRIAVGGGCTGGNFAAVLALMARDSGGMGVALQFLWSWLADARCDTRSQTEFADGYGLRYDDNAWVVSQYLNDPSERWDWRVSPILAESLRGVAPAFITVGEWDILRDEDVQYAARLRDAGVEVELHVLPSQGHVKDPAKVEEDDEVLHAALRRVVGRKEGVSR